MALGRFDLTNGVGAKLTEAEKELIRSFLAVGGTAFRRRRGFNLLKRLQRIGQV